MGDATLPVQTFNEWQTSGSNSLTDSPWSSLTHVGSSNQSAPHADSRFITQDINGNLIETDDGGIYKRTLTGGSLIL